MRETKQELPTEFTLYQNYPNPFNPTTTIQFSIPSPQFVTIKVYDILGREITKLVDEYKQAGTYSVNFNAKGLSSGLYFYNLRAGNYSSAQKMILIR